MSERCPQDGGFVGECGCTHPNHEHSELVKGLLAAGSPVIAAAERAAAERWTLSERERTISELLEKQPLSV